MDHMAARPEDNSRFTALFERLAIDVLLGCLNQTKAKELSSLTWDQAHLIQEKAVRRGLQRRQGAALRRMGVDEKSFLKGHRCAAVLSDLDKGRVLDVAQERKEDFFKELRGRMPEEQRQQIEAVTIDMWKPYINAVEKLLPEADIVHDKFHIAKYLGEAVDKVRKSEHKGLKKEGEETLKGTKYLWLTNPRNWSDEQKRQFKELKSKGLQVGRAWAIKELFSDLRDYSYEKSARHFFKRWYWWATHSRLKPMAEVAKTLKRHPDNILTYLRHRITNAVAEGINSKIQQVKSAAQGFRNFENYRTAILFFYGKLDMYPQESQQSPQKAMS